MPAGGEPSAWVRRFLPLVRRGGTVLDLACGSGRHLGLLAEAGFAVTGVDRDAQALAPWQGRVETLVADLEDGPWPLAGRRFDGVVVTNYLWRPRWPDLRALVAEGGVLIYETFAAGHEAFGRPRRPEFLLAPGELLALCAPWRVVAFEDGFEDRPPPAGPRMVQRIAAVRAPAAAPGDAAGGAGAAGAGPDPAAKIRRFPLHAALDALPSAVQPAPQTAPPPAPPAVQSPGHPPGPEDTTP